MTQETPFDPDDRRGWRYEQGGAPIEAAVRFLATLRGATEHRIADLVTPASLDAWLRSDLDAHELDRRAYGMSMTVRYPADGMAYVFLVWGHPDQTEDFVIEEKTRATLDFLTLVHDEKLGGWLVHQLGTPASPAELGKRSYPPAEDVS